MPQCDTEDTKFYEDWVKDAVPGSTSESSGKFQPNVCSKFVFIGDSNVTRLNETCPSSWFGTQREDCNQWVFDENERTIVNDVRIKVDQSQ